MDIEQINAAALGRCGEVNRMSAEKMCPIWGVPCEDVRIVPDTRVRHIQSSRAGGHCTITEKALHIVKGWNDLEKAKLSRWIYKQNQLGTAPKINSAVVQQALNWPMPSMPERIDFLLQFAESQTKNTTEAPILHISILSGNLYSQGVADYTLGHDRKKLYEIHSATATSSISALNYLMEQAAKTGLVTFDPLKMSDGRTISSSIEIAMNGYKRLEKLKKTQSNSDQAFVAMWFDDKMKDAWERGFEPAIVDAGYKPLRIDRKEHINKIDDEIIAEIRRSRFLVADFTSKPKEPRGGVYYEAGFAYGLNIPVIYTCRKDCLDDVHFDTRQFNHLTWNTPEDLRTDLAKRISAVLGDGPHRIRKQD